LGAGDDVVEMRAEGRRHLVDLVATRGFGASRRVGWFYAEQAIQLRIDVELLVFVAVWADEQNPCPASGFEPDHDPVDRRVGV
jgi:hypothetical protein